MRSSIDQGQFGTKPVTPFVGRLAKANVPGASAGPDARHARGELYCLLAPQTMMKIALLA